MFSENPIVSVVFPHHDDAQAPIAKANIESLIAQSVPLEIIVMDSSQSGLKDIPSNVKHVRMPRTTLGNTATRIGINDFTNKKSKYILPCNDDIVFSKHAVSELVYGLGDNDLVLNCLSNTDNYHFYFAEIVLRLKDQLKLLDKRFYKWEEIEEWVQPIVDWTPSQRLIVFQESLCMFATLFPRKVVEKLTWPEEYIIGWADTDLSFQLKKLKIPMGICFSALAVHLGGATTAKQSTDEIRKNDMDVFEKKWGVTIDRPEHLK